MGRKIRGLMPRELAGIFLLAALLLAGLFTSWYFCRQYSEASRVLEDSAWMALSGRLDNARETADGAGDIWERQWRLRAALGDQSPMEEMDTLFAELRIYGAAGEAMEFARVCSVLSQRMNAMGNAHQFSWWNVL